MESHEVHPQRRWSRRGLGAAAAWSVVVAALSLQDDLFGVGSWLDGSWQAALAMAPRRHVALGAQPLFAYGPLGFLDVRTPFYTQQWLEGVAFAVAVHVVLVGLIALLLWRRRSALGTWIAVGLTLVVALPLVPYANEEASLLVVVLAYLALDEPDGRMRAAAATAAGVLLAVLLLDKSTAVVIVGGTLVVTAAILLFIRRWRVAAALAATFVLVFAILWTVAGLHAGDVPAFVRASIEFGSGYGGAMYVGSPSPEMFGAVALLGIAAGLALFYLVRRDAARTLWFLLTLVLGFAAFKDDFVRTGPDRYTLFYAYAAVLVVISLVIAGSGGRSLRELLRTGLPAFVTAVVVALLLSYFGTSVVSLDNLSVRWDSYRTTFHALFSANERHALQDATLATAQSQYGNWIANLQLPRNATVDVMTWDTGLFYADPGLNWDPRPVLQSYIAYTSWLDQRDAAFFAGPQAPTYVVYSMQTIDGRYAVFDEPAAFRALLQHYYVLRSLDPATVLLERLPAALPDTSVTISHTCAAFGSEVAVPQLPDRWVFAQVDVRPSLVGRALSLLYKPPAVNISLTNSNGSHVYRFITAVADDGLFLSNTINGGADIPQAFRGAQALPIVSFSVSTHGTEAWQSQVCVTFTSTPSPSSTTAG